MKNAKCQLNSTAPRGYDCLCLESLGWTGDGIFTCFDFDECQNAYPCAPKDVGGGCVDHDPNHDPPKYSCFCNDFFRPEEIDAVHGPLRCVPEDLCSLGLHDCDPDNGICTQMGDSTVCSCPENFVGDGKTCTKQKPAAIDDVDCSRHCNLPKETCLVDSIDFPKCTCLDGFERGANGDSCQPIQFCNDVNAGKSCPAPGTNCIQLEGGFICLCKSGHVGGPNSVEGCILTPAPTTATPSFAPSESVTPTFIEAIEEVPAPAPGPRPVVPKTAAPTEPEPCEDEILASLFLQCLVNQVIPGTFVVDDAAASVSPSSIPKFEALDWIIDQDTLSFGGSKSTAADALLSNDELIQRFGMALLLFSLEVDSAIDETAHECDWILPPPEAEIECDSNLVVIAYIDPDASGGSIPEEVPLLFNLEKLFMEGRLGDRLRGSIPTTIGRLVQLTNLTVADMQFVGGIPSEVGKLTNLVALDFDNSDLTGTIPIELGQLTKMTNLKLDDNDLDGTIPTELGKLTNLVFLDFNQCELTGTIPTELGQLTKMTDLNFEDNELHGHLPSELGKLTDLDELDLEDNKLNGTIPTEIGNLESLTELDLESNAFSGTIPTELGKLSLLDELVLKDNTLVGTIPTELGQLTMLVDIELQLNELSGNLPSELGKLTLLERLRLGDNSLLEGSIPPGLCSTASAITQIFDGNTNVDCTTVDKCVCEAEL